MFILCAVINLLPVDIGDESDLLVTILVPVFIMQELRYTCDIRYAYDDMLLY